MLASQVHRFTPLLFLFALSCERASETLIDTPAPSTFALTNGLEQPIFIRVFSDDESVLHFTNVFDSTGAVVQRFASPCNSTCGAPPSPCKSAPQAPPLHELAPGQSLEETWDSLAWVTVGDPTNGACQKLTRVPHEPHTVLFCWAYTLRWGNPADEVCESYVFTPGDGERVEHVVTDRGPQPITFEIENARGVSVDIAITTGCSSAAGWVAVVDANGVVRQREYDCGSCLCSNACGLCDCAGPNFFTLESGDVVSERWNGLYLQGDEAGRDCGSHAIAVGSFTARFCWLRKDTRPTTPGTPECAEVPFTLGAGEALRHVIR